jgi:carbonic anhydrase
VKPEPKVSAAEALERLREGNARFMAGHSDPDHVWTPERRRELAVAQSPEAVILACSDSRTTPSMVFDQGLGSLFVVRVAGNVVGPDQIGSIEFAAHQLGVRLVVVLGHTKCGALSSTLVEMEAPDSALSPAILSITKKIRPALTEALGPGVQLPVSNPSDREAVLDRAGRANVVHSMSALQSQSELIAEMIDHDGLHIVGARHCLESGEVEFFSGLEHLRTS